MRSTTLPMPGLRECEASGIFFLTDPALFEACGVRVAFTGRAGGTSAEPYASLNLGSHVGDDLAAVEANRDALMRALGAPDAQLLTLNQVHGDRVLVVDAETDRGRLRAEALEGADAIVVEEPDVAALLCFADCLPVVVVSPSGSFAVAHAGWRGAVAGIAGKAARQLARIDVRAGAVPSEAQALASFNAYLGPCIGACCFEVGEEVRDRFASRFGDDAVAGDARDHVDLAAAVRADLQEAGMEGARIAASGICTACHPDAYFSYRASGGTCGRHGALAFRKR